MTLTLQDWDALPETDESRRLECMRGVPVTVPEAEGRHTRAGHQLWNLLEAALPSSFTVLAPAAVLLVESPLTVRIPDVAVLDADASMRDHRFRADQVHLVVEVLSPSNARTDRVVKLREYAEAGIPDYWILDLSRTLLSVFRRGGGHYELAGECTGPAAVETCGTIVHVDVPALGT